MDQAPLVKRDIEVLGRVAAALSRTKIPVTALDWDWEPEYGRLRLTVVTDLVDEQGPRESYKRILAALEKDSVYGSVPIGKLVVRSPEDPTAKQLIGDLKRLTEGSVHIVRNKARNHTPEYKLVFAPYLGSGGPIPGKHLKGNDNLREFLRGPLHIHGHVAERALTELLETGSTTIFNVQISLREAKRLNLAA